jgi:NitT/TauT family transport system substrate-binding protein
MLPHLRTLATTWALSLITAVALALGAGDASAQGQKLRIGSLKIASLTNVDVAAKTGIFSRNGLDVEVIQFRSGNEAIAAQRGGHVDIVLSIPGTAMNANERGFDLVLIAQNETAQAQGPGSGALLVLNDSGISSVSQLVGKKIATSNLHSQYHVAIATVLKKHGVDLSKVTFLELPFSSHPDALKSKQIDVSACLDPWTTQMRTGGYAKVLAWNYVESIPEQPIGAWYARKEFVDKNADTVARFAKSIRDSIEYMNEDIPRAKKAVADYTGLKVELLKDMPLNKFSYKIDPAKWQAVADMMHASGELKKPHKASEYLSDIVKPYIVK